MERRHELLRVQRGVIEAMVEDLSRMFRDEELTGVLDALGHLREGVEEELSRLGNPYGFALPAGIPDSAVGIIAGMLGHFKENLEAARDDECREHRYFDWRFVDGFEEALGAALSFAGRSEPGANAPSWDPFAEAHRLIKEIRELDGR